MRLNPGDHVCALYERDDELTRIAAEFLADGLRRGERCWYLPAGGAESPAVRASLEAAAIDVDSFERRGALAMLSAGAGYATCGEFDPEATLKVFSDAIEHAMVDGFTGFRAVANMSWALGVPNGAERLITYEALLRSLFATSRATGLCLYDRRSMPIPVIDGALATHPIVRGRGGFMPNEAYDPRVQSLPSSNEREVAAKLARLDRSGAAGRGKRRAAADPGIR